MTNHTLSRSLVSLLCLSLMIPSCLALAADHPGLSPEMQQRGAKLLARLQKGEPISVVAFGDSLTAGQGTDGRHVFHRMFVQALQYRFPQSKITLTVHGHPGQTTAGALWDVDKEVIAAKPDLVLVQYGGNDKGTGRSVQSFARDFGQLLQRISHDTQAVVIACLPPIIDSNPNNVWNDTARQVAAQAGVAAADLDRAIRQTDYDSRGPFPYGTHPSSFTHVIWAKEVMRAFDVATGTTPLLSCRFLGNPVVSDSPDCQVRAEIRNLSDKALSVQTKMDCNGPSQEKTLQLAPHSKVTLTEQFNATPEPIPGRACSIPVHLWVRGGGDADFAVGWLTSAPAISVTQAETPTAIVHPTWHQIGPEDLTMGWNSWLGPQDLSAAFSVIEYPDCLRFTIQVNDNNITVSDLSYPSSGDCVELYLDLRPDKDQGKPIYSPDVLALQIIPPAKAGDKVQWQGMQPLPEDLKTIGVLGRLVKGGYQVQVEVPMAAIKARRGANWSGLGFDIGIDDADFGGDRKTQFMWAGSPDNYIYATYLAGLYQQAVPLGATRRTLR